MRETARHDGIKAIAANSFACSAFMQDSIMR